MNLDPNEQKSQNFLKSQLEDLFCSYNDLGGKNIPFITPRARERKRNKSLRITQSKLKKQFHKNPRNRRSLFSPSFIRRIIRLICKIVLSITWSHWP